MTEIQSKIQRLLLDDGWITSFHIDILLLHPSGQVQDSILCDHSAFSRGSLVTEGFPSLFGASSVIVGQFLQSCTMSKVPLKLLDVPVTGYGNVPYRIDMQGQKLPNSSSILVIVTYRDDRITDAFNRPDGVASKAVSGLATMLAHEVRNPLSGIKGAAQLLAKKETGSAPHLTKLIVDEVARLERLVNGFNSFSDFSNLSYAHFNAHAAIEECLILVSAEPDFPMKIIRDYDPSLPDIYGPRDQFVQACLNIFRNAREALQYEDEPTVRVESRYQTDGRAIILPDGRKQSLPILIAFEDNGPGLGEDIEKHVFDPFVSSREGGTGLGLTLVAHVAKAMNGLVEAGRADAGGLRLVMRLPCLIKKEVKNA